MSYTNVFGGNTLYPSDVSYLAIALDADITLEWPLENSGTLLPAARILDVTPDVAGWSITLPDATLTGAGQVLLFNNLSGSRSFYVKDNAGNTLATIGFGEQWELYLAATNTAAGTWRVFRFGASTASVQPSSLAGYGLTVTGSTLSQATPVTTFNTSGLNIAASNRATVFVWNGTGAGTANLPTAAAVGNNFFVFARNEGGGDLVLDPSGTELINGASTLALRPGDSATVITDGTSWYTIGLGQEAVFAFDYTSITVTGGNYALAGSELNRVAYKFVGTLSSDVYIIVPATIQQYWINNATTGPFNMYVKTSTGPATQVNQGAKGIYYCDGVNMVLASDPTTLATPITVSDGGTGATTASAARLNLGITAFADPIVTATSAATVRTVISAAASGANNDITSLSGLLTPLSVAQGGTGSSTASGARTNLGGTTVGSNIFTLTNPSAITFLRVNADNTVSALNAADFRTAIGAGTSSTTGTVTSVSGTGTVNGLTLSGTVTSSGSITLGGTLSGVSLTTQVTGTLPVGNGGTGATTLTGILKGNGTSAFTAVTAPSGALVGTTDTQDLSNKTLTTGNTINAGTSVSDTGTIAATSPGFRGIPQNSQTAGYTLVLTDAGKHISITTGGVAIPANSTTAFPIGTTIVVYNNSASSQSITITTDTLRLAGTAATGTRTLAQRGLATLVKVASTEWVASGAGLT